MYGQEKANMFTNIFGLKKIPNRNKKIFGFTKKANTNMNTNIRTCICQYEYKYLSQTVKFLFHRSYEALQDCASM